MEEKRLQREAEKARLEKEMKKKRLEWRWKKRLESKAKLQFENLATQVEFEMLQVKKSRVERESIEARAEVEVQLPVLSQASLET